MKIENLSIRARVAFALLCLELIIIHYEKTTARFIIILNKLWSYTNSNMGIWHMKIAEICPDSILEEVPFIKKGCHYINEFEHDQLVAIYHSTNVDIKDIINLIFEIGAKDLYSSICNNSPETIEFLERIINILISNKIKLPDINILSTYTIDENHGWGRAFKREDLFG